MDSSRHAAAFGPQVQVIPLAPPRGATSIEEARRREERFLERFQRNFARRERVLDPIRRKAYSTRRAARRPEIADPYPRLASILKSHAIYDRGLLECLPHDRAVRYSLPARRLWRRAAPRVVIVAAARSPIARLARLGGTLEPLGRDAVLETIEAEVRTPRAFHVMAILSTVGWERELTARPPCGEGFALVLVEPAAGGGWQCHSSLPDALGDLVALFDPEDFNEKVNRAYYAIQEEPELRLPGGHVEVERFLATHTIDRTVLDAAVKQVALEDPRLHLAEVGGRQILKRARYS